ncbi:DUF6049 family protein [Corynebacterium pacaense]|uniref:DUF6049 family protein n=1 Tax=Corynebacterium pacaense TaxID=1816684 RepID=UPI0011773ADB|nr:DUF6049 family protein [Corynebacterium pacaense]
MTATTVLGISSFAGVAAIPFPVDPDDPVVSQQWANPLVRSEDRSTEVELEITALPTGTVSAGETLQAQIRISNGSDFTLSGVTLSVQRQQAAADTATARTALAAAPGSFPYYGRSLTLEDTIGPGESVDMDLPVATGAEGLAIPVPGVYPTRIALSAVVGGVETHMDSQRFLLPVDGGQAAGGQAADPGSTPTPTTMLYPISAPTDVLGGETGEAPESPALILRSDSLAAQLREGGRLNELVDAWTTAPPTARAASCLAVDPELLSVVTRMAGGYSVSEQRVSGVKQNQRLRDLWTASAQPEEGADGTGAEDAAAFLAKLRTAASGSCTVALPWANTDLNAVSSTGNQWLMREALQRGTSVIEEVLGVSATKNVVIPGGGYVTELTAKNLGWADIEVPGSPENAWESQSGPTEDSPSGVNSLDDPAIAPGRTEAPEPPTPVSVLIADNTVWGAPSADRFSQLAPGIRGVSYQGSLSATLATLGQAPETVGYSNPQFRFDYSMDSPAARNMSARAAVELTVGNGDGETPVLIMPPTSLEAGDADMLLQTTSQLVDAGRARPFTLGQYLSTSTGQLDRLAATATPEGGSSAFGAPFDDPTSVTETEVLRATQQSSYTDDLTGLMTNDPAIALTRYGFTEPLRQDLLRALSMNNRRSRIHYPEAVDGADRILNGNRDILQQLRSSVALLPPGNVYTRTSSSSPLIIVAQNGLPLPAIAQIMYSGPENAQINTPGLVRVPALGSITLQMTADLPDDSQRTDLTVWLASPDRSAISDPVDITVQPRPGFSGTSGIIALIIAALAGLLVIRVFRVRRSRTRNQRAPDDTSAPRQGHGAHRARPGASQSPKPPRNN